MPVEEESQDGGYRSDGEGVRAAHTQVQQRDQVERGHGRVKRTLQGPVREEGRVDCSQHCLKQQRTDKYQPVFIRINIFEI